MRIGIVSVCACVVIAMGAATASAQSGTAQGGGTTGTMKRVELDVGYQWTHVPDFNLPAGFAADIAVPFSDMLSAVGEFGWARRSESGFDTTLTTYGGGVRWHGMPSMSVTPFAQVIAGGATGKVSGFGFSDSDTHFMLQPGAGVSVPFGNVVVIGSIDYRRIFISGGGENELRVFAGVRLDF